MSLATFMNASTGILEGSARSSVRATLDVGRRRQKHAVAELGAANRQSSQRIIDLGACVPVRPR